MAVEKFKRFGKKATLGIEGDIVGACNNVDYNILIQLISKRRKDKDFINLMKSLLKSGVLYQSKYTHAIKETLQGGIVSPLLFNIYMFELDKFISKDIKARREVNFLKRNRPNKEYGALRRKEETIHSTIHNYELGLKKKKKL